ncbi:MAG: hypothetical protein OXC19_22700 [Bryobacterales bacterium]|nr:hypothetical protein [Bryobacterales bacterium]
MCAVKLHTAAPMACRSLSELAYPFLDKEVLVTHCERICMHHEEVNDAIWLVSFMHYDLGHIDLSQKTLQTIDNPFGPRLSPMS